jgi:hypothetical protein
MPYFAKVIDNKVTQVIAAEKEFFDVYVDPIPGEWIQTSYNTRGGKHYNLETNELSSDQSKALRANYAGIGYTYDPINDVFYAPQPYASWVLNNTTWTWEAPTPYPTDGKVYTWDEATTAWVELPVGE